MATEIRINTVDGCDWLYGKYEEWKDYVSENFDENVVITGNRDYTEIAEAKWYTEAKELLDDIDECVTFDGLDNDFYEAYKETYTKETLENVYKVYDKCTYYDNIYVITEVSNILNPEIEIETAQIRGYTQGEWQEVAYVKGSIDLYTLEAYYFGQLADVTVNTDDDEYGDVITHEELWNMESNLKEELRKRYDIGKDEELVVLKCDGYRQVADWKEVM